MQETPDLVHLSEEKEIWQKRNDTNKQAISTTAVDNNNRSDDQLFADPKPVDSSSIPNISSLHHDGKIPALPSSNNRNVPHVYNRPIISASKSEHRDILSHSVLDNNRQTSTPTDDYDAGVGDLDTQSIHSSEKSKSTTKKSQKSLTRRLSSFLSRSFRRKRNAAAEVNKVAASGKRVSYPASATTSERPPSLDTQLSFEVILFCVLKPV